MIELDEKKRIIQEFVPGKQVTLAHVIANPTEDLYLKLGLIDASGAIGISPPMCPPRPRRWRSALWTASTARWSSPAMWRRYSRR